EPGGTPGLGVEVRAVEPALDRIDTGADPRHRMADRAREPGRIAEGEFDDEREQGGHDGHTIGLRRRFERSARARWRSRRSAAALSRRTGTFRRPIDRDQSPTVPVAVLAAGNLRAPAGVG